MKTKKGVLPNLIIIGAQKCGTSSLHYYLNLHPEISMSREKELHFFSRERYWNRGIDWYKSHFIGSKKIFGEASPSYTIYPFRKRVAERMYSVVPNARLIYMVRDPLDRMVSHYIHRYAIGWESRPIEEALGQGAQSIYVAVSRYHMQLEQYLKYFPRSNILIITLEELFGHRQLTIEAVFRFLDVYDSFSTKKFSVIRHSSEEKGRKNKIGMFLKAISETKPAKIFSTHTRMTIGRLLYRPFTTRLEKPVLSEDLKKELCSYLKDDMDRLRKLTGRRFKKWCV